MHRALVLKHYLVNSCTREGGGEGGGNQTQAIKYNLIKGNANVFLWNWYS